MHFCNLYASFYICSLWKSLWVIPLILMNLRIEMMRLCILIYLSYYVYSSGVSSCVVVLSCWAAKFPPQLFSCSPSSKEEGGEESIIERKRLMDWDKDNVIKVKIKVCGGEQRPWGSKEKGKTIILYFPSMSDGKWEL